MNDGVREVKRVSALEGYERWAETYDSTPNPVVSLDARHSVRVLTPAPGERILDAGCGTGRNLAGLKEGGAEVFGVDFSPAMLRVARRRHPDVDFALADLQQPLPLKDEAFDAVLCTLVGEHLTDLPAALGEFRRVLKPGGRLLFSVYHPDLAASGVEANFRQHDTEYRVSSEAYSVDDYVDFVAEAGFPDLMYRGYRGDQTLADQFPDGSKYLGAPVLLVIAAIAG